MGEMRRRIFDIGATNMSNHNSPQPMTPRAVRRRRQRRFVTLALVGTLAGATAAVGPKLASWTSPGATPQSNGGVAQASNPSRDRGPESGRWSLPTDAERAFLAGVGPAVYGSEDDAGLEGGPTTDPLPLSAPTVVEISAEHELETPSGTVGLASGDPKDNTAEVDDLRSRPEAKAPTSAKRPIAPRYPGAILALREVGTGTANQDESDNAFPADIPAPITLASAPPTPAPSLFPGSAPNAPFSGPQSPFVSPLTTDQPSDDSAAPPPVAAPGDASVGEPVAGNGEPAGDAGLPVFENGPVTAGATPTANNDGAQPSPAGAPPVDPTFASNEPTDGTSGRGADPTPGSDAVDPPAGGLDPDAPLIIADRHGGTDPIIWPKVIVTPEGTLSPGHSPGDQPITGDLQLDGSLLIEIEGTDPLLYDRLLVDGHFSANDALVEFAFTQGFAPEDGDIFSFLFADSGLDELFVGGELDPAQMQYFATGLPSDLIMEIVLVEGAFTVTPNGAAGPGNPMSFNQRLDLVIREARGQPLTLTQGGQQVDEPAPLALVLLGSALVLLSRRGARRSR